MCTMSVVHDYGRNLPDAFWTKETYDQFKKLVEQAMKFDKETGQPGCQDPNKVRWIEAVEQKVNKND